MLLVLLLLVLRLVLGALTHAAISSHANPQVMKKRDLIRKNMVESVTNERNILAMAQNPFVVRFYYSFTSRENLYIVMEYINGGDCYR